MALDLLSKGWRVVDPGQDIDWALNSGVQDGKISILLEPSEPAEARQVIDISAKLATPGLVDLHAHVYWGGTPSGPHADSVSTCSGVTTFVDAGSAGAGNFKGFLEHAIKKSRCRILAFLNILHPGLVNASRWIPHGDGNPIYYTSVPAAIEMGERHSDTIVGVRVMASGEYNSFGLTALQLGIDAVQRLGKPVMVHRGTPPLTTADVLREPRSGDIMTHSFRGGPTSYLARDGTVTTELLEAKDRGVLVDIGHGLRSFSAPVARAMLEQGVLPDVISNDLHVRNIHGPVYDLPTTMSKMLGQGMDLVDVVAAAATKPARAIGRRFVIGSLNVGSSADTAVFDLAKGTFEFSYGVNDGTGSSPIEMFVGSRRLDHVMTFLASEALDNNRQDEGEHT